MPVRQDSFSLIQSLCGRVEREVRAILDDLDASELDDRPAGVANSCGWLCWHIARGVDRNVSEMNEIEQLWTADRWAEQFGRRPDPSDTGYGHSVVDVEQFRSPAPEVLLDYFLKSFDRLTDFLSTIDEISLHRESLSPTLGNVCTVRERLSALVSEGLQHLGQLTVVRDLVLMGRKSGRGFHTYDR